MNGKRTSAWERRTHMSNIDAPSSRVNKSFTADAVLARWQFLTLGQFLRFPFPEPDHVADRFSGLGKPDFLAVKRNPAKAGKFLFIVPTNTARLLQVGELHRLNSRHVHFCVAPPDALGCADMEVIVEAAPDLNGFQIDLAVLTPEERAAVRSLPIRCFNVDPWLARAEAERERERRQ
jgi:hypothetical protein